MIGGEYGIPAFTVLVDEDSAFGRAASGLVVHREKCHTCGTVGTGGQNRRLCVVGNGFLNSLVAAWVAQGHHRSYAWMVTNAV